MGPRGDGLGGLVERVAALWKDEERREEARTILLGLDAATLEQLVLQARTHDAAAEVLYYRYEGFVHALLNDVVGRRTATLRPDQDKRIALRKLSASFPAQSLELAGIDRETVLQEIRERFFDLVRKWEPGRGPFHRYITERLPQRVHDWLREHRRKRSKRLTVGREAPGIAAGPESADGGADDSPIGRLLDSRLIRALFADVLVQAGVLPDLPRNLPDCWVLLQQAVSEGYRINPVLIPGQRKTLKRLLVPGGGLRKDSRYYQPPQDQILPLYIPDGAQLEEYLTSSSARLDLALVQGRHPGDKCWEILTALYQFGEEGLRQDELAARHAVTQQYVSKVRHSGIRRLLRAAIDQYCQRAGIQNAVVYLGH